MNCNNIILILGSKLYLAQINSIRLKAKKRKRLKKRGKALIRHRTRFLAGMLETKKFFSLGINNKNNISLI